MTLNGSVVIKFAGKICEREYSIVEFMDDSVVQLDGTVIIQSITILLLHWKIPSFVLTKSHSGHRIPIR